MKEPYGIERPVAEDREMVFDAIARLQQGGNMGPYTLRVTSNHFDRFRRLRVPNVKVVLDDTLKDVSGAERES